MLVDADVTLVAAIADDDDIALSRFDARFRPRIEAIARKRSVPTADCPDVAQEVLADAIRQIRNRGFRGQASLSTWMYTLTIGKVTDYWRKHGRRVKTISLDRLSDGSVQHLVSEAASEQLVAVEQALSRLPARERLILVLYEREGYTLVEIGRMLGLGKSAVSERLQLAREHFRDASNAAGRLRVPRRLRD